MLNGRKFLFLTLEQIDITSGCLVVGVGKGEDDAKKAGGEKKRG